MARLAQTIESHHDGGVSQPSFVPSIDGVSVAVHDFGGDGPVVVISHATGFNALAYRPLAERLRHDFRVFAIDHRGHGYSKVDPDVPMHWSGMGSDLAAVIRHIDVGPVAVIGHSMGGAAAVLAATSAPNLIRALWAFEPILVPAPEEYVPEDKSQLAEGAARRRADFESLDAVIERFGSRPPLNTLDPAALRGYVEGGFEPTQHGVTLRCRPETEAAVFNAATTSGAFDAAADLRIPTVAALSGDGQPPSKMGHFAVQRYPELLEAVHYDDLNHFGPLQDPKRIAVDASRWLDSVGED